MNALAALAPFVRFRPFGWKRSRSAKPEKPLKTQAVAPAARESSPTTTGCQFCNMPIGPEQDHAHVVDIDSRELLCACGTCTKLAALEESGQAIGPHRLVPTRVLHDRRFHLDEGAWAKLQIPVGLVFFFFNSRLQRWVALYPSPGGAAESQLPLDALEEAMARSTSGAGLLSELRSDVEALLIHRTGDPSCEAFVVPIDACYRLVGRLRAHWQGFGGGDVIRRELDAFFEDLRRRALSSSPQVTS